MAGSAEPVAVSRFKQLSAPTGTARTGAERRMAPPVSPRGRRDVPHTLRCVLTMAVPLPEAPLLVPEHAPGVSTTFAGS
jgi:hypothetical protein